MLKPEKIRFLVVHCSDTPDFNDIGASEIHQMHLDFGWDGIGYHKVIRRNGEIENGRPEYWIGAHLKGKNEKSVGVCLIGKKIFTENQYNSLEIILKNWKEKYPFAKIKGHSEATVTNKTCPNFNVTKWCRDRMLI